MNPDPTDSKTLSFLQVERRHKTIDITPEGDVYVIDLESETKTQITVDRKVVLLLMASIQLIRDTDDIENQLLTLELQDGRRKD